MSPCCHQRGADLASQFTFTTLLRCRPSHIHVLLAPQLPVVKQGTACKDAPARIALGMSSPNSAAWQEMRKKIVAALKSHPTFPCFCSFTSATSSGFKGCHCHGANPSGQAFICIHTRTHTHARPHKARLSSGTGSIQSLFPILVATIPTPTARSWVEREKKPELY